MLAWSAPLAKGNKMKKILFLFFLLGLIIPPDTFGCTVFYYADSTVALAGNNEDFIFPYTQAVFYPAENKKYGRVYFGYTPKLNIHFGEIQGGVNDQGLFFDGLATEALAVTGSQNKPTFHGNLIEKAMETCATVEEVIALYRQYNLTHLVNGQLMFGDKTGDAAIIEGDEIIRKKGRFQVATNFYLSKTMNGDYPCQRFRKAKNMLENRAHVTIETMRDICNAVHQEGNAHTLYSNVYDLKNGIIYLYLFHDYNHVVQLNLAEELKKGHHVYDLASLFPENREYLDYEVAQSNRFQQIRKQQKIQLANFKEEVSKAGNKSEETKSAEEILKTHIDKIGGLKAIEAIATRLTHGEMELEAQTGLFPGTSRFNGTLQAFHNNQGKMYQSLTINGVGVIEQGINGTVVWKKYSSGDFRILEGEEKAIVRLSSVMESNQKKYFSKIEIAGIEEIQGQRCIKLLMTPEGGGTHARFFSEKTGLMVAAFYAYELPTEGPILTKLFLENYKEIDGILLPHFMEIESTVSSILGSRTSKARFKLSYEHNVEIPEERFKLPGK